tara:strand:+ start:481 stop:1278 length:798 start_codon:yes stop_codon:yes gene_type:complete
MTMERQRVSQQIRLAHLRENGDDFADNRTLKSALRHSKNAQDVIDRQIMKIIKTHPLWTEFNVGVKGVGEHLLALFVGMVRDVTPLTNVSKLWWLCGLGVTPEGKAVRKVAGVQLNYNEQLKMLLLGRLGPQLIRSRDPFARLLYEKFFIEYREKAQANGDERRFLVVPAETAKKPHSLRTYETRESSRGNVQHGYYYYSGTNQRAIRKVVKLWVACCWVLWRRSEGLPVTEPYAHHVLGHTSAPITVERWLQYNQDVDLGVEAA